MKGWLVEVSLKDQYWSAQVFTVNPSASEAREAIRIRFGELAGLLDEDPGIFAIGEPQPIEQFLH